MCAHDYSMEGYALEAVSHGVCQMNHVDIKPLMIRIWLGVFGNVENLASLQAVGCA